MFGFFYLNSRVTSTKARIHAKKAVRDRYLDLLKQAKNMKEILEVQTEINEIQENIEAGSGRVQYLVHQAAYSTIHLTYFQYLNGNTQVDSTPSFFSKLKEAFNDGASIVTGILLLLVTFWPFVIGGIIVWMIVRKSYWKKFVNK